MIGEHPTVGCLIQCEASNITNSDEQFLQYLDPFIPSQSWMQLSNGSRISRVIISNREIDILFFTGESFYKYIFLEFDEDVLVSLFHVTGMSLIEILSPFISVLQSIECNHAIGIGFEMSIPSGLDDDALRAAGITTFFQRNSEGNWGRREVSPVVGHYS